MLTRQERWWSTWGRRRRSHSHYGSEGRVEDYKYLGVVIGNRSDWKTKAMYKNCMCKWMCKLYFLRKLRSFLVCNKTLDILCQSVVASTVFLLLFVRSTASEPATVTDFGLALVEYALWLASGWLFFWLWGSDAEKTYPSCKMMSTLSTTQWEHLLKETVIDLLSNRQTEEVFLDTCNLIIDSHDFVWCLMCGDEPHTSSAP